MPSAADRADLVPVGDWQVPVDSRLQEDRPEVNDYPCTPSQTGVARGIAPATFRFTGHGGEI